jgi:Ala-tRNA(Pro) deacylase
MPASPEDLMARLEELGIRSETHRYPPLFTVEESKAQRGALPGGHCKSLFLKDKKRALFLVVALEDRAIDLKWLRGPLGVKTLSFGQPELLMDVLGVIPGAVTPFAVVNDGANRVRVFLDSAMPERSPLNYHPLTNEATTAISPGDLVTFLAACGHAPRAIDFDAPRA